MNWSARTLSRASRPTPAPWLLKQEMRRGASALLRLADETAVPAGHALAVDRVEFSRRIAEVIEREPKIRVIREEVTSLDSDELTIIATGPLTSDALSREILRHYRLRAPVPFTTPSRPSSMPSPSTWTASTFAARWDKGTADYINCPMTREEYDRFLDALIAAEAAEEKGVGEARLLRELLAD